MTKRLDSNESESDPLSDQAANNTLALNPLVGVHGKDLMDSAAVMLKAMMTEPMAAAEQSLSLVAEFTKILTGQSDRAPPAGDKRFKDATWKESTLHRSVLQAYLAWGGAINTFIQKSGLSDIDKTRAHLFADIFIDAVAPTNNLLGNPAAVRRFLDTGGQSLWEGSKNYLNDLVKNGGLPSQVDKSPFKLGGNIATTAGAVVFRNDLLEVIQYTAGAPLVRKRPIVVTPPQINKFYCLDLSPDKSLVQFMLKSGFQMFCVSWRNPTAEQRDWGLDTYIAALDEATDAVREITTSDDVTMMGACSGGITTAAYAAWLAGRGEAKIKNIVAPVCVLDVSSSGDNGLGSLMTPETMLAAKAVSQHRGVLDGEELARVFAWMRPNDLIWNYWVNNYLLGKQPPAFDILFWNADTTCLPARLHHDYIDLYSTNPFVRANKLKLNGVAVDMKRVKVDAYVVAGVTDHITPWKAVYQTAKIYGDDTTFVLSNAGHLQCLLNPPTNSKATFVSGLAKAPNGDTFLENAEKKNGSWWLHWRDWLAERSGAQIPAPVKLGSARHPAGIAAPGTYVFDRQRAG